MRPEDEERENQKKKKRGKKRTDWVGERKNNIILIQVARVPS